MASAELDPEDFRFWTVEHMLEVEEIDRGEQFSLFRSVRLWRPPRARAVFGGQVIGQSLVCATRTVGAEMRLHSMHCYFLLGGKNDQPIVYQVRAVRDGRSFATRLVLATQGGRAIFHLVASFQRPEAGVLQHQWPMPAAPDPEALCSQHDLLQQILADERLPERLRAYLRERENQPVPIEFRPCEPVDYRLGPQKRPPRQMAWFRSAQPLDDDVSLHQCVAAYASDYSLLPTAVRPYGFPSKDIRMMASLDHAIHFHDDFRADEWLLYVQESSVAGGGRAYTHGRMFTQDGRLVASTVQEGVVRLSPSSRL